MSEVLQELEFLWGIFDKAQRQEKISELIADLSPSDLAEVEAISWNPNHRLGDMAQQVLDACKAD